LCALDTYDYIAKSLACIANTACAMGLLEWRIQNVDSTLNLCLKWVGALINPDSTAAAAAASKSMRQIVKLQQEQVQQQQRQLQLLNQQEKIYQHHKLKSQPLINNNSSSSSSNNNSSSDAPTRVPLMFEDIDVPVQAYQQQPQPQSQPQPQPRTSPRATAPQQVTPRAQPQLRPQPRALLPLAPAPTSEGHLADYPLEFGSYLPAIPPSNTERQQQQVIRKKRPLAPAPTICKPIRPQIRRVSLVSPADVPPMLVPSGLMRKCLKESIAAYQPIAQVLEKMLSRENILYHHRQMQLLRQQQPQPQPHVHRHQYP
jgi:hypothetical protein